MLLLGRRYPHLRISLLFFPNSGSVRAKCTVSVLPSPLTIFPPCYNTHQYGEFPRLFYLITLISVLVACHTASFCVCSVVCVNPVLDCPKSTRFPPYSFPPIISFFPSPPPGLLRDPYVLIGCRFLFPLRVKFFLQADLVLPDIFPPTRPIEIVGSTRHETSFLILNFSLLMIHSFERPVNFRPSGFAEQTDDRRFPRLFC